jgi:hypothetical protein
LKLYLHLKKKRKEFLLWDLSHEENLAEASKLNDSSYGSVVISCSLTNAHDEKIQAEIDLIESEKLQLVKFQRINQVLLVQNISESSKKRCS